MIRTKEFPFPKSKYFTILLKNSLRRNLWTLAFLVVIAFYQAIKGTQNLTIFLSALPIAYFAYLTIRCRIHANSKVNKLFFKERIFEIDDQAITVIFKEGNTSTIQINNIARVIKNSQYYLLFLTKKQFVYVPLSAFRTAGDINKFDSILKSRKRKK